MHFRPVPSETRKSLNNETLDKLIDAFQYELNAAGLNPKNVSPEQVQKFLDKYSSICTASELSQLLKHFRLFSKQKDWQTKLQFKSDEMFYTLFSSHLLQEEGTITPVITTTEVPRRIIKQREEKILGNRIYYKEPKKTGRLFVKENHATS